MAEQKHTRTAGLHVVVSPLELMALVMIEEAPSVIEVANGVCDRYGYERLDDLMEAQLDASVVWDALTAKADRVCALYQAAHYAETEHAANVYRATARVLEAELEADAAAFDLHIVS